MYCRVFVTHGCTATTPPTAKPCDLTSTLSEGGLLEGGGGLWLKVTPGPQSRPQLGPRPPGLPGGRALVQAGSRGRGGGLRASPAGPLQRAAQGTASQSQGCDRGEPGTERSRERGSRGGERDKTRAPREKPRPL